MLACSVLFHWTKLASANLKIFPIIVKSEKLSLHCNCINTTNISKRFQSILLTNGQILLKTKSSQFEQQNIEYTFDNSFFTRH